MKYLFRFLLLFVPLASIAQSNLPLCPSDSFSIQGVMVFFFLIRVLFMWADFLKTHLTRMVMELNTEVMAPSAALGGGRTVT